jgi:hypothetical protein
MSITGGSQISSPFASGGGGTNFEIQVQAAFAALMLADGFAPCLPCRPIQKLQLQGRRLGFRTDDLVVFTGTHDGPDAARLLVQVKHGVKLTKCDQRFGDAIKAAWLDFVNPAVFRQGIDKIALVSGPLSATDIEDAVRLPEWARTCNSAQEFLTKVDTLGFSSGSKKDKLGAFRSQLNNAAGYAVSDEELLSFLRHYHILGYDLDLRYGVMHALLHSVLSPHAPSNAEGVWAKIMQEIMTCNQNGGTVTRELFPRELRDAIAPSRLVRMSRRISSDLPPLAPHWRDRSEFGAPLMIASLLGCWDERVAADIAVAEGILRANAQQWLHVLRELVLCDDAPLVHRGGAWSIGDRRALWEFTAPRIFDQHLKSFHDAAIAVLKAPDPKFDLDQDQRFAAGIYGKVAEHSGKLRGGLAETLAILGSTATGLANASPHAGETIAADAVKAILIGADWQLWATLNDLLPLLAEAAPAQFMDAVEAALRAEPCPFDLLFAQEGVGPFGSNYLTGLFWSLETLAWDERHIVRAATILGALAARDPGGQWANRPAASLSTIFLPWFSQTRAPFDKQMLAVQAVCKESPQVGWSLLLSLMPNAMRVSSGTRKPVWRLSPGEFEVAPIASGEFRDRVVKLARLAVELAQQDVYRIASLTQFLHQLPASVYPDLVQLLNSTAVAALSEEARFEIWAALLDVTRKHRKHSQASWALSTARVEELERVVASIAPSSPAVKHRQLFVKDEFRLYDEKGDLRVQQEKVATQRRVAVDELLSAFGVVGVIAFAQRVEAPSAVGLALGGLNSQAITGGLLPRLLHAESDSSQQLIRGFVIGAFQYLKWDWVDSLDATKWPVEDRARLLLLLPFSKECWNRAERWLGEHAAMYWQHVTVSPWSCDDFMEEAIDLLMTHGRPRAAVDCLAHLAQMHRPIDPARATEVMLASVVSHEAISSMHSYQLVVLIRALQANAATPLNELAKVEWAYLPVIASSVDAAPSTLEVKLASDPTFFCEVVQRVFTARGAVAESADPTEDEIEVARNGYQLLRDWRVVPGTGRDGAFDPTSFEQWMCAVEPALTASKRLEVGLQAAGAVLIHSPADPGGLWIHSSVAEVLDRVDAVELRKGYQAAVRRSRGAYMVDPTGESEDRLASEWHTRGTAVENAGFHRLADTCRLLSDQYKREAELVRAEHAAEGRFPSDD